MRCPRSPPLSSEDHSGLLPLGGPFPGSQLQLQTLQAPRQTFPGAGCGFLEVRRGPSEAKDLDLTDRIHSAQVRIRGSITRCPIDLPAIPLLSNEVFCDFLTYTRREKETYDQPGRNAPEKVEYGKQMCCRGGPREQGDSFDKRAKVDIRLPRYRFLRFIQNHGHLSLPCQLRRPSVSSSSVG